MLVQTLHHLEEYQRRRAQLDEVPVPWTVENVVGAKSSVSEMIYAPAVLCGTMFGLRVLRHRLFLSSDKLQLLHLSCTHDGKHVGSHGHSQDQQTRPANMYGPYSWRRAYGGSTDGLHFAMGYEPGSFTYRGLTQDVSVSYGRWVCNQLVAAFIRLNHDLSLFAREELRRNPLLNERLAQSVGDGRYSNQPTGLERDSARRSASSIGRRWPFKRQCPRSSCSS
eukprot:799418-Pleurochrysis_carterae.AAC.1